MAKKLFIFDYDGVIVDSLKVCMGIANAIGEKYDLPKPLTEEAISAMPSVTMDRILLLMGAAPEKIPVIEPELLAMLREKSLLAPVFSGIAELFRSIHQAGNTVAVNTANDSKAVANRLAKSGMMEYVSYIVGADTKGEKAEKIRGIMTKFGASPDSSWMIGDTMGDITEGRRAGVRTIAVTYGWQSTATLESVSPQHICHNIKQLREYITSL